MKSVTDERWVALGAAVAARREALRLSARAAAERAEINRATWATLEGGKNRLSRHLFGAVESALRWAPGSIADVLGGGEPTPVESTTPQPAKSEKPIGDLPAEIERIRSLPLPAEQRLTMVRALIDLHYEAAEEQRRSEQAFD